MRLGEFLTTQYSVPTMINVTIMTIEAEPAPPVPSKIANVLAASAGLRSS